MKKAMVLGNCQSPQLARVLTATNFAKHYEIVSTFPVQWKNPHNMDNETLYSLDLFIHQPISDVFGKEFSSDYCKQQLKPSCVVMTIPSLFFSAYFPQHTHNPVIRRTSINTMPSGIMPHGDSNCIKMLIDDIPIHKIVDTIIDPDFYDKNYLLLHVDNTYQELKKRELRDKIDIKASDFF